MLHRARRVATVLALTFTAALAACAPPPATDDAGTSDAAGADATSAGDDAAPSIDAPASGSEAGGGGNEAGGGSEAGGEVSTGPVGVPTYWGAIAPILNSRCVSCHSAGGIGPMPLTNYAEARPFARLIAMETAARRMPPFLADTSDCRPMQANPRLSTEQLAQIEAWATNGAPEGTRDQYVEQPVVGPARPLPARGDLELSLPRPYTPRFTSLDHTRCFVVDPGLTETRDVVGLRVLPGNDRIVHHVILYEVREAAFAQLTRLENQDAEPGYECFGSPGIDFNVRAGGASSDGDLIDFDTQWIGSWAPGSGGGYFPTGTGIRLRARSRVVMEIHYFRNGADAVGMTDQTRAQLFFSPSRQPRQALWLPVPHASFRVPAGAGPTDPAATSSAMWNVPIPAQVYGVAPHMHVRGYSMRADIVNSTAGTNQCLLDVPRWDFGWQGAYWLTTPWRLSSAMSNRDSLRLSCTWDNSAANQPEIDGVRTPPRELRWGESTDAEMCLLMLYVAL